MISDIHNVMQTELDGKPSRSVRIIVNVLNACCTAANALKNVYYKYTNDFNTSGRVCRPKLDLTLLDDADAAAAE